MLTPRFDPSALSVVLQRILALPRALPRQQVHIELCRPEPMVHAAIELGVSRGVIRIDRRGEVVRPVREAPRPERRHRQHRRSGGQRCALRARAAEALHEAGDAGLTRASAARAVGEPRYALSVYRQLATAGLVTMSLTQRTQGGSRQVEVYRCAAGVSAQLLAGAAAVLGLRPRDRAALSESALLQSKGKKGVVTVKGFEGRPHQLPALRKLGLVKRVSHGVYQLTPLGHAAEAARRHVHCSRLTRREAGVLGSIIVGLESGETIDRAVRGATYGGREMDISTAHELLLQYLRGAA